MRERERERTRELQELLDKVEKESGKKGLTINSKNTVYIVIHIWRAYVNYQCNNNDDDNPIWQLMMLNFFTDVEEYHGQHLNKEIGNNEYLNS